MTEAYNDAQRMRLTKIVCTLGPTSQTPERLRELIGGGMNIARLNLSHGTHEQHRAVIASIRSINAERGHTPVAIMLDTKGPEVRTGDRETPIDVGPGEEIVFSFSPQRDERRKVIKVDYKDFAADVQDAECILVDNGEMAFDVVSVRGDGSVVAKSREGGTIGSRRHVNLPGSVIHLPSITPKDWQDITFAADEKLDFIALSFLRDAETLGEVRRFLEERNMPIRLVAKIETQQGVDNLGEIIDAADGVMVARGDLGAEVPFERLPAIQDEIVSRCRDKGKPVIIATHMLESMIVQPIPTRAEITDIAHAATSGADATMLSGETASGKHPLVCLRTMDKVLRATEEYVGRFRVSEQFAIGLRNDRDTLADAAINLAKSSGVSAIVVFTRTGRTAQEVSRLRPMLPIIACTDDPRIERSLQLSFGVTALHFPFVPKLEDNVATAVSRIRELQLLQAGEKIVLLSDMKTLGQTVETLQVRVV